MVKKDKPTLSIKEVSEKYGVSQDTLRYYERVGMIPPVQRTASGIRSYTESDVGWVEMAICMRNAGLPVEVMIDYLKLYMAGNKTIKARLSLLQDQRMALLEQKAKIEETIERLDYKISRYEVANKTGKLTWPAVKCCKKKM